VLLHQALFDVARNTNDLSDDRHGNSADSENSRDNVQGSGQ
jgi:hypothetical protein